MDFLHSMPLHKPKEDISYKVEPASKVVLVLLMQDLVLPRAQLDGT